MDKRKETPEEFTKRTGNAVPRYMAVYAHYRMAGKRWNLWKILPFHEAETMKGYYNEYEIFLANSDFCPVGE
jgi:hypothetical protein